MNDQPPSDKKPRRRSAPRKRAPETRTAAGAADAPAVAPKARQPRAEPAAGGRASKKPGRSRAPRPPEAAVDPRHAGGDVAAATLGVREPRANAEALASEHGDRVADVLDPAPLLDRGGRGDAPATDAPSVDAPVADGARSKAAKPADAGFAAASGAAPTDAHGTPAATTSNVAAERGPGDLRADAAPVAPANVRAPAAETLRQSTLRPGELIRVPLSVRWRDLDAFNHVNNSKYLSYLEEARLRWMLSLPGMGMDDDVAPVVAASTLNYRRPIAWPSDVVIELFVERVGGSSVTIGHRIVDATDGRVLYCDGNVVLVWIDRRGGKSAPLPDTVRSACRQ